MMYLRGSFFMLALATARPLATPLDQMPPALDAQDSAVLPLSVPRQLAATCPDGVCQYETLLFARSNATSPDKCDDPDEVTGTCASAATGGATSVASMPGDSVSNATAAPTATGSAGAAQASDDSQCEEVDGSGATVASPSATQTTIGHAPSPTDYTPADGADDDCEDDGSEDGGAASTSSTATAAPSGTTTPIPGPSTSTQVFHTDSSAPSSTPDSTAGSASTTGAPSSMPQPMTVTETVHDTVYVTWAVVGSTTVMPTADPSSSDTIGSGGGEKPAPAAVYKMQDNWVGDAFYSGFDFYTDPDPSHGRVNYVDQAIAQASNLSHAGSDSFIMRADAVNVVGPTSRGRDSVRITSKKHYTTHVLVADIRHMPAGNTTWPALWEVGDNWPSQGELDIVEGVNDNDSNLSSLHTNPNCTQPPERVMSGTVSNVDCDATQPGNIGCGVSTDAPASFGPSFNNAGGGWYAVERTDSYIKVWFWGRDDGSVPAEVRDAGTAAVNPDSWDRPTALFTSDQCSLHDKFGPNQIVINLTFCGDWAGNVYSGGREACIDFVNNQPAGFSEAYWDFARLSVYV